MEYADVLIEEKKLMTEAKYRNYMSNIDKALRNFEYSSEWADLISALGKLSKAISSNTQYQVIPRRLKISKRLAQCMHPALPSGVHLKALETYDVIFNKTGPDKLATELFIYSAGLFPLLGYAAMNVRPTLLGIYEKYFVPLGEKLRPALSGFLSGVLPGYENGLDHYERTNSLLMQVCAAVNPLYFYTDLWKCVATNASIRLPAITYLLEHFNKRLGMKEQIYIMGQNRELMISGLCACLNDSVILVQRNTLEFLLLGFPMHTIYLNESDRIKLVTNGLNTILRRDMSLNRRLYSWLLGSEIIKTTPIFESIGKNESYFDRHSKNILIQSLICTLKFSLESSPVDLKPYRIMVSLLDKAEIGTAVLDYVLCDIVRTMTLSSGNIEVGKSANLLFATFDPAYIWSFMTIMYEKSCKKAKAQPPSTLSQNMSSMDSNDAKFQCEVGSGEPCLIEICYLTEFLLETISLEMYNETTRIYLPKVFLAIVQMLTIHLENISNEEITASLKLCMKIVSRVQPMITSPIKLFPRNNQIITSDEYKASDNIKFQGNIAPIVANVIATNNSVNPLEKSKSDSKLNHFAATSLPAGDGKDSLSCTSTEEPMRRSASNQNIERRSPKKTKKAKSYSKLSELDKEICPDTGQLLDPHSSSDLDTPQSIKKFISKTRAQHYVRLKTSPKKPRQKHNQGKNSKPFSPGVAKKANTEENVDISDNCSQPATPIEPQKLNLKFNYDDPNVNTEEQFSILEKCIRQYEIFFEVYLSRKILQINKVIDPEEIAMGNIKVNIEKDDQKSQINVEDIFKNEQVYQDSCVHRLREIEKYFDTLKINVVSRSKQLHHLLSRSLITKTTSSSSQPSKLTSAAAFDSTSDFSDCDFRDCISSTECLENNQNFTIDGKTERNVNILMELHLTDSSRTSVKLASNLLVEMSTFPNCNKDLVLDKMESEIPNWLKVLCLTACYIQNDKELQLAAIATLFDLISLLKSQIEHTTSPGVTFVVMLPLMKFGHISYIENKTRIFQLITSILWNYLGDSTVDPIQITSLLYQLHNCLESGLVETVIGNRMFAKTMHQQFSAADALISTTSGGINQTNSQETKAAGALNNYRVDRASDIRLICVSPAIQSITGASIGEQLNESESQSFKKFELLWHLGREKQQSKGFEKTLLKVLDTLGLPYFMSVRTFVTKWLQSSLLRDDLSRLIKPLYKILLSPNSRRIGIVHMHLIRKDGEDSIAGNGNGINQNDISIDDSIERDVYAISSEFGNVKYHLDSALSKKRSPIRNFQKKLFGVTLSSKNKTSNFLSDKLTTPMPAEIDSTIVGVIVNPLNNATDFDIDSEDFTNNNDNNNNKDDDDYEQPIEQEDDDYDDNDDCDESQRRTFELSSEESESSAFDTESDNNRDTSVEKDDSLSFSTIDGGGVGGSGVGISRVVVGGSVGNLKRFVGDCERVTEILSQHDRTKNRKTYHLTRAASEVIEKVVETTAANINVVDGKIIDGEEDSARPADEYFSGNASGGEISSGDSVELFVKDLCDQVAAADIATINDEQQQQTAICEQPKSSLKKKLRRAELIIKKQASSLPSTSKSTHSLTLSASTTNSKKKRMSCISKVSTDSNTSLAGGCAGTSGGRNSNEERTKSDSEDIVGAGGAGGSDDNISGNHEENIQSQTTTISQSDSNKTITTTTSTTINVEDKRRSLSLETSKQKTNWDLTQETLEKGKQNVQILRQNVASNHSSADASKRSSAASNTRIVNANRRSQIDKSHLFHNHILVYFGIYDTKQTLYAFQTLRNILSCDTRTFLCLSITTSLTSGTMKQLLIRHRKSIAGKGFAGSISNSEFSQSYRGCMHLEILVTICLYFTRGFFYKGSANDGNEILSHEDIVGNCKVQLESVELLTLICTELIHIVKGMGKGLACYIADLMGRCKLQKIILHCLNSSVISFDQHGSNIQDGGCGSSGGGISLPEQILQFNNPHDENLHAESFQVQLLRLLMAVIKLEYEVKLLKNDPILGINSSEQTQTTSATGGASTAGGGGGGGGSNGSPTRLSAAGAIDAAVNVKYLPNLPISQQPMFLAAVLSALQDDRLRHLHRNWTDLVTSSLNCFTFGSLTNIVISVVHQLCNNIDRIAKLSLKEQCAFPPDYVVSQLEAITILCHYCLLDNTQQTALSHLFNQAYPQISVSVQSSNTGQLLNNIVHSFLSTTTQNSSSETQTRNAQLLAARNAVLSHLFRIVASVAAIWDSELGQLRQVKQQLMEFLSPVSLHHGTNFLAAVAVTWQERGEIYKKYQSIDRDTKKLTMNEQYLRNSIPQACPEQLTLVTLVSSIRVMPMDSFVQTLHQVVKTPPPIHRPPAGLTIEVSALELFYFYMKSAPAPQLGDSWTSLLALLRDGLSLSPPAQFALLMLLNEFVQRCPQMPFQDKKDIRDLHDITSRLVDTLSNIAGSCLEQTTWLRRNLAVKEDISPVTPDGSIKDLTSQQQYCVQAQCILASILSNLLDVAYGSQEKDKVVTIITTLMYNITPYLKNHTVRNIPSFYACSSLLASISGYQYTRKAWRKDMFDLLLDNAFFQMDFSCLPFWKQIMDSLMTYDNTTFRELMSRVSLTQTGSLNIFASREQEYEQRAMLLKRLAFVIFCSESDQFHKYMPEIQEQLANSLRLLSVVPSVQAAVFLCFRVLLLRMSPDHVTSMWPIIIAEMVQVFLAIEQELKSDSEELSQQMRALSGIDQSWTGNLANGFATQNQLLYWRAVQLEAVKLLEMGCVLPATSLPHFQMYRWAFVGTDFDNPISDGKNMSNGNVEELSATISATQYVPHVRRIAKLMDMKYAVHSPKPEFKRGPHLTLTCQQINSLQDLYGFFSTLTVTCPNPRNFADTGKDVTSCLTEIEDVLAKDFLEKMPTSSTPR